MKYIWKLVGWEHEKVGREPGQVGIGAHLEKNRRTRRLARGNPEQNAQAHQGSRPGRRRGVEVGQTNKTRHPGLVARRDHLHWHSFAKRSPSTVLASRNLSLPLSSRARRSLPLRWPSTPSARRRRATRHLRRGSPCR